MSEQPFLTDVLILLMAAVALVPLSQRLGLGAVVGYLAAGVVVGPWGLKVVVGVEDIRRLADLGVVFLLFLIGVELKPARLWVMRAVFGLGFAQVVVTGGALMGLAMLLGIRGNTALLVGFGLALSSTAVGLQILTETREINTHSGRSAVAVLLLQDLALVPLLALMPFLADTGPASWRDMAGGALEALLVLAAVVVAGRFLLRPVFRLVASAGGSEIFAATAVLAVLGTAWLVGKAGLSMALGAFIAGLLLADSEYRHQVEADIQPFRGFLLGLFFMAVGTSIDFGMIGRRGMVLALLVIGLLAVKVLILFGLARLFRLRSDDALRVSLLLSQSGEFAFILFAAAASLGLMTAAELEILVMVVAVTIAVTPLLWTLAWRLTGKRDRRQTAGPAAVMDITDPAEGHVIVAGFGRFGLTVCHVLGQNRIPYLALDLRPERVAYGLSHGYSVFFGDASRADVLRAAGAERARLAVVALDRRGASEQAVSVVHHHYPNPPIYARARDRGHSGALRSHGAVTTVRETVEARLQLAGSVLRALGIPNEQVSRMFDEFRRDDYKRLDEVVPPQNDQE